MKAVKNEMLVLLVATGITFLCVLFLFERISMISYVVIRPFIPAKESLPKLSNKLA